MNPIVLSKSENTSQPSTNGHQRSIVSSLHLKSSSSHTRDDIPSLTSGTTSGWTYAPSILSENIWILSHQSSDAVKVKAELAPEILVYNNGGLSDNDELTGEEREVAIKSPPKGKKRMTSEVVSFFFHLV